MFSSTAYKSLNKLRLYKSSKNLDDVVFSAYSNSGWGTNLSINLSNLFSGSSGSDGLSVANVGKFLLQNYAEKFNIPSTSAFDFLQRQVFSGSTPSEFSFPCFLILQESYKDDLLTPLLNLGKLFLPTRDRFWNTNTFFNTANDSLKESDAKRRADLSSDSENLYKGETIYSMSQKLLSVIRNLTDSVYSLNAPEMLNPDKVQSLTFSIGNILVEEVILTNVKIDSPSFFMQDSEYGVIPDKINLTLNFKTLRGFTFETLDGMLSKGSKASLSPNLINLGKI